MIGLSRESGRLFNNRSLYSIAVIVGVLGPGRTKGDPARFGLESTSTTFTFLMRNHVNHVGAYTCKTTLPAKNNAENTKSVQGRVANIKDYGVACILPGVPSSAATSASLKVPLILEEIGRPIAYLGEGERPSLYHTCIRPCCSRAYRPHLAYI